MKDLAGDGGSGKMPVAIERMMAVEVKQFSKGSVIFREGVLGSTMYEVLDGTVGIFVGYGREDEKKLTELERGRIFGEMAAIEARPRSATAVALTDVSVQEISRSDFQEYFSGNPDKLLEIMRGMTRRIRELTVDYQEVCATIGAWKDADSRGAEQDQGLMSRLRRFAQIFAEGMKYVNPGASRVSYYDPTLLFPRH